MSPGIELWTWRTKGRALTNCATLAANDSPDIQRQNDRLDRD